MFLRISAMLFLLFVIPVSAGKPKPINFNQQFSANVAHELKQYSIPGAAYVVVKDNRIIALESFGHVDKAKSSRIDSDTVFRLASVSKTFAATVTTMLAQEKRLNLSDSVTKYIPHFKLAKRGAADKIQLKHLLSHSTGLMPNAYDNLLKEDWSMDKIIRRFDRVNPICRPALCYGYQNIAFSFLQSAIEASQPKSYATLLQDRVFSPLKMKDASVGIDVFLQNQNTAKPHLLRKRTKTGKKDRQGHNTYRYNWRTTKVRSDFYKVEPAAGVNASITDLAKWLIANMGHNPDILPPALLSELTTLRIKTKKDLRRRFWKPYLTDAHYGYGWRIYQFNGHPIIYHSGWVAGFCAEIGYSAELGIGFALLINAESSAISKISSQFWAQARQLVDTPAAKQI
jgi:beta-lactamase class C